MENKVKKVRSKLHVEERKQLVIRKPIYTGENKYSL